MLTCRAPNASSRQRFDFWRPAMENQALQLMEPHMPACMNDALATTLPGVQKTPAVSILIPTHNRCAMLIRTMESLREIRLPGDASLELIVVANGCTDE